MSYDLPQMVILQLDIYAVDKGTPPRRSEKATRVTVNVVRNKNAPVFQKEPYSKQIKESAQADAFIMDVSASDADKRVNSGETVPN